MKEIWKDIRGYEGLYQVSNFGRVKSFYGRTKEEIILSKSVDNKGYCRVILYKNNKPQLKLIHRLVAIEFINNIDNKPQINHINGIKSDNKVSNLEWCTGSENMIHAYKIGLEKTNGNMIHARKQNIKIAVASKRKKVTQKDIFGNIINEFNSVKDAIDKTGIKHVSDCALGKCEKAGGYIWEYKTT